MIARMQNRGASITGIRIGMANARRYFPGGTRTIDLELDDLRIRCELNASFWRGKPEICDRRLCAWLESQFLGRKLPAVPVPVEMVWLGDCYRLHVFCDERQRPRGGFGLIV
jgi:hypothetical protein